MTLLELIRSLDTPSVESLAKRSGTGACNLKQIAYGFSRAGPGLASILSGSRAARLPVKSSGPMSTGPICAIQAKSQIFNPD